MDKMAKEPAMQPIKPKTYDAKIKEKKRKPSAAQKSADETQVKRIAWSAEEHEAFLMGHKKLGNAWMLIAQLYVPSKTPRQVGSKSSNSLIMLSFVFKPRLIRMHVSPR